LQDLEELINKGQLLSCSDFATFFDKHYPGKTYAKAMAQLLELIKNQIEDKIFYTLILAYSDASLDLSSIEYKRFQMIVEPYHLFTQAIYFSENELINWLPWLCENAKKPWLITRIINALLIQTGSARNNYEELYGFLSKLLEQGDMNMLNCVGPQKRIQGGVAAAYKDTEDKTINLMPIGKETSWQNLSIGRHHIDRGELTIYSPFSIDVNHIDGCGPFYLLCNITENPLPNGATLANYIADISIEANLAGINSPDVRVAIGCYNNKSGTNQVNKSGYWLHSKNLLDDNIIDLCETNWNYMGANNKLALRNYYTFVPLEISLRSFFSIYFIMFNCGRWRSIAKGSICIKRAMLKQR